MQKKISLNDLDCQVNYYKKKWKEKFFFISIKILVDHQHNKYSLHHSPPYKDNIF